MCLIYNYLGNNIRHIKGVRCVFAETMINVTCRECPSIELHRTVAVVTKTGTVHHEAHVQQKFCCTERLLPPQSTEGQTAHRYTTRLCSLFSSLFTLRYYVLSFSSFCPPTLSHCSPGKWGGNHESLLGVWKSVCACVCVCVQVRTHVRVMGDCVIQACGLWNLRSGQRKRGAAAARYRQYRAETLFYAPFLHLLPLGRYNSCTRYRAPPVNGHTTHKTLMYDAS